MNKLLSIIIPTYNMEEYLPRCLNSIVGTKYIDDIEILVVNDGSKDSSSEIAHSYKARFPQSVVVIDKENGNYGSTINTALPIATGKYVKVLDADDWFDLEAFDVYLDKLREIEADLIVTPFTEQYVSGKKILRNDRVIGEEGIDYDLTIFIDAKSIIEMHAITYKLTLLTNTGYKQTEGISYTDTEWAIYPMEYVNVIQFISANVYQYYLGREGQTMSGAEMSKNYIEHMTTICSMIVKRLSSIKHANTGVEYMYMRLSWTLKSCIYVTDAFLSQKDYYMNYINKLDEVIVSNEKLSIITDNITTKRYLYFHFVKHWRKNNRNFSPFASVYISLMDKLSSVL